MVAGTTWFACKAGSTKMIKTSISAAGIDIGKTWLDVALAGGPERWRLTNDVDGHAALIAVLLERRIARIGLEASGGYERAVTAALRAAGFEVILFQPRQVRAYAVFRLRRAKTDTIDAALIAACAAAHERAVRAAPDARLLALAEPLRLIEQIEEDIVRLKTRREAYQDQRIRERLGEEIRRLKAARKSDIRQLKAALCVHPDLARRLTLVLSVPGLGERTALTLLVRMPELGTLSREQAASLAGLTPFDHDSGQHQGQRRIAGGREPVRSALFAAALPAAFRWNQALISLYQRLIQRGRSHAQALIACARKLLIYANTVLARGTPWTTQHVNGCSA
jgi:transposase